MSTQRLGLEAESKEQAREVGSWRESKSQNGKELALEMQAFRSEFAKDGLLQ